MSILEQIAENLEFGEDEEVAALTRRAVDEGMAAKEILNLGLLKGMEVVGGQFKRHEIFLPDVLLAARAMHAGMELLKPLLIQEGVPAKGKIVLGTVQGDLHDIGKNLVGIMLKGAGYEIVDLGTDVPPQAFIDAAVENQCSLIGMSALLTTTMPMMKEVVQLMKQQDLYHRIKIIVGGAPVSREYALEIGAHAFAFDGTNAVQQVDQLLSA